MTRCTHMPVKIVLISVLGAWPGLSTVRVDFTSEKASTIKIAINSREQIVRIWSAPAEAESTSGNRGKFDLVSISTPDNLLWWGLLDRLNGTPVDALADFVKYHQCIADGRSIRCFVALVFKEVLVRTCDDRVPAAQRQQFLASSVADIANPGAWSLMDSFQRVSVADVAGVKGLFRRDGFGGLVRAVQIYEVKKTSAGYELGLRHADGPTGIVVLNDELKVVSGRMAE
jgi:hypothetical protein